ncbi:MAG TPA: hypothetical protein VK369_15310 [Segetibacter sp.]|nr:hypothetical protein [Segetibacter sp.]
MDQVLLFEKDKPDTEAQAYTFITAIVPRNLLHKTGTDVFICLHHVTCNQ